MLNCVELGDPSSVWVNEPDVIKIMCLSMEFNDVLHNVDHQNSTQTPINMYNYKRYLL